MVDTIKTSLVVVLLLAVLFGVYTILNRPEPKIPREAAWMANGGPEPLQIDDGSGMSGKKNEAPALASAQAVEQDVSRSAGRSETSPFSAGPASPPSDSSPANLPSTENVASSENNARDTRAPSLPLPPLPAPDLTPSLSSDNRMALDNARLANSDRRDPLGSSPDAEFNRRSTNTIYEPPSRSPVENTSATVELPRVEMAPQSTPNYAADGRRLPDSNPYVSSRGGSGTEPSASPYDRSSPQQPAVGLPNEPVAGMQYNPYIQPAAASSPPSRSVGNPDSYARISPFKTAWQSATYQIESGKWRDALLTLSNAYRDPNLTAAERAKLHDLLDPLAAKVVYSTEHLIDPPHVVRAGENLQSIAASYSVPVQLLKNINNVSNPDLLLSGTSLKVLRGPFEADVDLVGQELTLYVQRLYAGRFSIAVGNDPAPLPGSFEVRAKEIGHPYLGRDGQRLDAADPRNPFSRCWIDLGREMSIHGSSDIENPVATGCIRLSPRDADDVFGILSQGSRVTVRR